MLNKHPIRVNHQLIFKWFFLLPSEFRAPADQEVYLDFDELEYEEIVAKLTVIQYAIFDKPALKGFICKRFC